MSGEARLGGGVIGYREQFGKPYSVTLTAERYAALKDAERERERLRRALERIENEAPDYIKPIAREALG